ncbi:MAG: RNA polymerase sigma factor [Chloroflexota bacterium]
MITNESLHTDLIARCVAGELAAQEEWVRQNHLPVYRLALATLDDPAEADDIAQEVLLTALDALKSFRGDATLRTWLYTLTVNACRGRMRKQRVRQRLQETLQGLFRLHQQAALPIEEQTIRRQSNGMLWEAIQALPDGQRMTVILRYYQELPVAEVAQVLQISERSAYERLQAAHAKLRASLGAIFEDDGGAYA